MTDREPDVGAGSWIVWLARLPDTTQHLVDVLDTNERQRRDRFRLAADRDRFTVGAALLRLAAADHIGVTPGDLHIDRTCPDCGRQHGRPHVLPGKEQRAIDVSVAHAGQLIGVALSSSGFVGVDVEVIPARFTNFADVACAPAERHHVRNALDFATMWTRKESILKAAGTGLRRAPSDVIVSAPDEPARLIHFDGIDVDQCTVVDVRIDDVHCGAVALLSDLRADLEVRDGASLLVSAARTSTFAT